MYIKLRVSHTIACGQESRRRRSFGRKMKAFAFSPAARVGTSAAWKNQGLLVQRISTPKWRHIAPKKYRELSMKAEASSGQAASTEEGTSEGPNAGWENFKKHQKGSVRLSIPEAARTLVKHAECGVLATLSSRSQTEGFPSASLVDYVADDRGRPIFALSTLSSKPADIIRDGRCSLMVTESRSLIPQDQKCTLTGVVWKVKDNEVAEVKEIYLKKRPDAFWINFGDFSMYRMDEIYDAQYIVEVQSLARVGRITGENYISSKPDEIAAFSVPISKHMNEDHADSMVAMVQHYVGIEVESANMARLDSLGLDLRCVSKAFGKFPCRVPFPRQATSRKDVRDLVVEMTRTAAAAGAAKQAAE